MWYDHSLPCYAQSLLQIFTSIPSSLLPLKYHLELNCLFYCHSPPFQLASQDLCFIRFPTHLSSSQYSDGRSPLTTWRSDTVVRVLPSLAHMLRVDLKVLFRLTLKSLFLLHPQHPLSVAVKYLSLSQVRCHNNYI